MALTMGATATTDTTTIAITDHHAFPEESASLLASERVQIALGAIRQWRYGGELGDPPRDERGWL